MPGGVSGESQIAVLPNGVLVMQVLYKKNKNNKKKNKY